LTKGMLLLVAGRGCWPTGWQALAEQAGRGVAGCRFHGAGIG